MDLYTESNKRFFKLTNLIVEDVRGEWWIQDDGSAIYADGDIGDMNHEGYVINMICSDILNKLNINTDEDSPRLEDYENEIAESLSISKDQVQSRSELKKFLKEFILESFSKEFINDKQLEEYLEIALGSHRLDAREYALRYWRWKRMKGNEIETQNMSNEDLIIISRGIANAYGDEIDSDDEPFNIDVRSTRVYYRDVPLSVIEERDAGKLNYYK